MTLPALKNSCLSAAILGAALLALAVPAYADFSLSPSSANIVSGGGSITVQVISSDPSATWTASSDQSWLTFTSATSGQGNGSFSYSVPGNPAAVLRIANVTVTATSASATQIVTQLGGVLSSSPSSANANVAGDRGTVTVSANQDSLLQWTATASDVWVTITAGASGIGPGSVQWTAAANTVSTARNAVITITPLGGVGQTFTISQPGGSPPPGISVSPSSITSDAPGGSGAIQVTASSSSLTWSAVSSNPDIVLLTTGSGTGNGAVQYTVKANPLATSRTATITITPGQGGTAVTVTVTLLGGVLATSPSSANVPATGGSGPITLTTNDPVLKWTVSADQSWVTITTGGQGTGPGQIQWTAAANTTNANRSSTVSITPSGGTAQQFYINESVPVITGTITLTPGSVSAPASASNGTTQVTSTNQALTWSALSNNSWLTVTQGASGTGSGSFQYSAAGNPTGAARMGTITVTPANGTGATLTVTQAGGTLTISPTAATANPAGDTGSVSVSTQDSSLQWTATATQPWITITSGASGTGSGSVQWSVAPNTTNASLSGTISVTSSGGTAQVFSITQVAQVITGTITLTPGSVSAPASASSGTIQVTSTNQALTWAAAVSNNSWLTITQGASGTGNGSFQYSAAGNPTAAARMATITVTPANGTGATLTVTQAGGTLTISPTSATANPAGDTGTISVSAQDSSLQWTATTTQAWITITSGASGAGSGSVQWSAAANTTNASRSGTISVTPSGGAAQVFSITQAAQVITGTITLTPPGVNAPTSASNGTIQVTSTNQALTWTAVSNNSWLTITQGASGTGNGSFQYSAAGNPTAAAQTGTITVTPANGTGATLTVYQAGGTLTISPMNATANPAGDTGTVSISAQDSSLQWTATKTGDWITITAGASGAGSGSVQWSAAPNTTNASRTGTISITPSGGTAQLYSLTQAPQITGTITLNPSSVAAPAPASNGTIQVTSTNQALTWTAVSNNSWLTITQGASGTGNGSFQYSAGGNTSAAARMGTITVTPSNGTGATLTVTQAGGMLTISPATATANPAGDTGTVSVSTQDSSLQWTAAKTGDWITITAGASGTGSGSVQWSAAANTTSASRSGTISVTPSGGTALVFSISQTVTGTITLTPSSVSAPASASTGTIQVTSTNQALAWTAVSNNPWLTITQGASGTGNGSFQYSAVGNPSAASQTGTITVTPANGTGATLTITQAGGTLTISPTTATANPAGDTGTISVSTQDSSLQWTATKTEAWITITSGASGTGSGSVQWTAAPNAGSNSRTTVITITPLNGAGQTFTITQSIAGSISVSPVSITADGPGASGAIQVTASSPSLTWSAVTSNQDVVILTTSSGTGNGAIQYTVRPNPLATSRTATITVTPGQGGAAMTVTVTLAGGVLTISPASASVAGTGGSGSIALTTNDPALRWTVSADQSWVTITSGGQGTGSGQIQWTAAANTTNSSRTSTISVTPSGGTAQLSTITQAPQLITGTITLTPGSVNAPASISNGTIMVASTNPALTWAAGSSASWLTVTQGATGTGNGTFQYSAAGNPTAATRMATITVTPANGTASTLTVSQAAGALAIDLSTASANAGGDTGSFSISTNNSALTWSAANSPSWLTITTATSGTGDATMSWAAAANTSANARTATITITPQGGTPLTFTVIQAALSGTITAMPSTLSFSYQQLGSTPAAAQVTLNASVGGLPFTTSVIGSWLSVMSNTGTTPGVLTVSVNPSGLAVGTYQGAVLVTSAAATNNPVSIPVTFIVSAAPVLTSAPNALSFSYQQNGSLPGSQNLTIGASGSSLDYTIAPNPDAPWITAAGAGPAPATITVSVNPAGLAPGTYQGNVSLISPASGNSPFVVPVSLIVSATPNLIAAPASLSVTYRQLDPAPDPIQITVTSSGQSLMFAPSVSPSTTWLSLSGISQIPALGSTPARVQFAVDPSGLAPGSYQGSIIVTSANAGDNPLNVPVSLAVLPPATLSASPSQVSLGWTENVSTSSLQSIAVLSDPSVGVTATVQTSTGGNWLTASISGNQTPAVVTLSAVGTGLAPGSYLGALTLTSPGASNSPVVIPVTLTVSTQPQLLVSPPTLNFSYQLLSGSLPPQKSVAISTADQATAPVSAVVNTSSGGNWLTTGGGTSTPGAMQMRVDPTGLPAGAYYGNSNADQSGVCVRDRECNAEGDHRSRAHRAYHVCQLRFPARGRPPDGASGRDLE